MKKVLLTFLCVLCFGIGSIFSQSRTITGTVTDGTDGSPIPGASVHVKGTTVGTITQADGTYSLSVPEGAEKIVFSFVGMKTQELDIGARTVINSTMDSDTKMIDEVIVVAYGTVKREAKTGSVASVSGDKIAELPVSSIDKALAGKMAGVSITSSSGQPGASSDIRIRGNSSINAGNNPLWVVDGIPIMTGDQSIFTNTSNALSSLNMNDVESITVLKDAAAASVYGSRAANGVILVTTKSGKDGKAKFSARAKVGISWLANDNNYGVMTGEELLGYQRDAVKNAQINGVYLDPDNPNSIAGTPNYNPYYRPMEILSREQSSWIDWVTRYGKLQEYEINASGGNARGNYYSSLLAHRNDGVFYGIDFSKFSYRINADYKLTNKIETGSRINVAYTEANDVAMQSLYYVNPMFAGMTILPWTPRLDEFGDHNVDIPENSYSNPRATAKYDDQFSKQYRFTGSMYLQWTPIKDLVFKTTNAFEGTFEDGRRFWSAETNQGTATLQTSRTAYTQMTTSNTATYSKIFDEVHSVRLLGGQEAMISDFDHTYLYSPDVDKAVPYPNTSTPDRDEGDYYFEAETMLSYFGILDYSYDSRYYLQASIRYDGSSLFGANNIWGLFWSAGVSWNLHNEEFMKDIDFIDMLKIRASYGVNGNNNIEPYRAYGLYRTVTYNGATNYIPQRPENKELSWERNYTWNAGLDFGLLGWLSGSVDVYNRKTTDMLLSKRVPQTTGFTYNFMNIGELENKGVELQLDAEVLRLGDFVWEVGANIAFNRTKIIDLADNTFLEWYPIGDDTSDGRLRHIVNKSFLTFWLREYYGVNPTNGEPLFVDKDGNLTNVYDKARYIEAGSPEPKYIGGFNTALSWRGFNLGAFFEFKGGNKVLIIENRYLQSDGNQMSMNQSKSALNYWKKEGQTGVNPQPIANNTNNGYSFNTTRFLERGDYLRVKDITLSYTVPKSITDRVMLGSARLYVSGLNIYTFHDVDFWDPERGVDGMGYGIYPMTKSFIGGIEITF